MGVAGTATAASTFLAATAGLPAFLEAAAGLGGISDILGADSLMAGAFAGAAALLTLVSFFAMITLPEDLLLMVDAAVVLSEGDFRPLATAGFVIFAGRFGDDFERLAFFTAADLVSAALVDAFFF